MSRSNCLCCVFRSVLLLGCVCGWSPLISSCSHGGSPGGFKVSFYLRFFSILLLTPLAAFLFATILNLSWLDQTHSRLFLILCEGLTVLASLITGVEGVLKVSQRVGELNGLQAIVANRRFYGVQTFLTSSQMKKTLWVVRGSLLSFFIGWSHHCYLALAEKKHTRFDSPSVKIYAIALSSVLQGAVFFQFLLSNYVYEILFKRCFEGLKLHLTRKNEKCGVPLLVKLQRLQRLYAALMYNYKQLNRFYNPSFLIGWVCLICIMIISIILEIIYRRVGVGDVPILAKYLVGFFAILVYIGSCERINTLNRDIFSFIFKYPFCKLTPEEALQLEMFLETMIVQKPRLTASDVFTVGTQLLAPICGTIVTYVLVAMQFHALGRGG